MRLRIFTPTKVFHNLQDAEVQEELKRNPRIGSFKRILRNPDGTGGENLIVDKTRQSIIYLMIGLLYPLKDRIGQRLMDNDYILRVRRMTERILKEYPDYELKTDFTLVRNASSIDLITAVKDGGLNTSVIIDGHGTKTWVNMTDGNGKRVSNNKLLGVVGDEKLGVLIQSTCTEYIFDYEGHVVEDDKEHGDTEFGSGLAKTIIRAESI